MAERKVHYTGAQVQAQVIDYCRALGLHVERKNTGAARYRNADGRERVVRFNEPGTADLECLIQSGPNKGKHISIECKATGERPTMHQFDRIMRINQVGGIALWVDSLDTAVAVLPHVMRGARIRYIDELVADIIYQSDESHD